MAESKEKLKHWFKDKYNLGIVLTIIIALAVRIYYLIVTNGQTLWWDEAEYMATAKHWAFGVPYDVNLQRPPLFQLLTAIFLKMGLTSEIFLKFALVVIPSVLVVFFIYLLGKEMFNKKVGLIAAFASVFIWSFLFWSARFQPDFLSLIFQLLAIIFFWKLFKHNKRSYAIYAGVFTAIAFYFKISALLIPLSVFIFVLFKDGIGFVKNKNYWITLGAFIVALIPFGIWQYVLFGSPVAFAPSYIGGTGIGQGWDFGWMVLNYFYQFPKVLFFVLFLFGLGLTLFKTVLSFDLIIKSKEKRLDAGIFSIIILAVMTLFYIFYIRGTIEDRWAFMMIPFILYFSALGLVFIYDNLKKYNKLISLIAIVLLLGIFIFFQVKHTDALIEVKKDSYLPVKEASLWIKDHSNPGDKILSNSYTQATAYSEREIIPYPALVLEENSSYAYVPTKIDMLDKIVLEDRPRYIMVSIFERHPDWIVDWLSTNSPRLEPVHAYFADPEQKQPILIVYEISYS